MKIPGFITVRSTSSRLPNKCFLPFGENINVLQHMIRRAIHYDIDPIVCTSIDPSDDAIETLAKKEGVKFYRGPLINKLQRWADCAKHFELTAFHTVDADDPFFDGEEMHRSFKLLFEENLDVVSPTKESSAGAASVGYSLKTKMVIKACSGLGEDVDTEMMWFYLDKIKDLKKIELSSNSLFKSKLRLTLDYQEDYWLLESIRKIIGNFSSREELNYLFEKNPDLHLINWFRNQEWKSAQEAKKI